jgi:hypothetical protein
VTDHSGQLATDWFDTNIYRGCIALSIVLPAYVPFQSVFPIRIVEDLFENRGNGVAGIDDRWMNCPYTLMTKWIQAPWPIRPWLEDISIAENAFARAGIGTAKQAEEATTLDPNAGNLRSVLMVILPVKKLSPALDVRGGKVNAITFVHWTLAEWMRAVRIGTQLPVQDLTIRRMPVVVPVRYAEIVDGALRHRDMVDGQPMPATVSQCPFQSFLSQFPMLQHASLSRSACAL